MSGTMPGETVELHPLVRVENLRVRFGNNMVLRDIDIHVRRGESLAVIGESGCGKTVLLKTLIGLVRPIQGDVWFDGRNLGSLDEKELTHQRTRFGFVFQNAALFDSMTIGQNVAFPLRQHRKMSDSDIQDLVVARLAEVGLPSTVLGKKPAELSGGMRKRVGLARALAMDPELVLYDEPTTGLDPIMSDVINELMINTSRKHAVTSVIVTHDMRTAHKVANRVVMLWPVARLDDGAPQVIFDGPPEQLEEFEDPRVVQFVQGEARERLMEMSRTRGDVGR
jgi:phospholipid/cholesterol/gamma-HCH transport system ATP-binding protein